jgi:two-component system sensor histidine kinase KdpD
MAEEYKRPDPDLLLKQFNAEKTQHRGRIKIFLGYAAGVGKTYSMLEAAHQRVAEGIDVVVAYVETHGRKETDALLKHLEVIPRIKVQYRGKELTEMDLDAVLARKPQLALVDELAHTNAPGSRHPKRYQDVDELLKAGIDVYTTVNIQHLESLKDVVQQITGVSIRETIPDSLVDEAYDIEVIDLPPDELLRRLRDGKVYVPEQVTHALERFFRKGNLTALRELSLRRAADRVDNQMVDYMQSRAILGPWPAGERILVSISPHPMGERLIRTGRRLADDLNAGWYVVFVETPGHLRMPEQNRQRIQHFLQLAEELGATVEIIPAESVADAVINFAKTHNITKIIAGKPLRPRWFELLRGSVIDQIIRSSGKIDVYVVSEDTELSEKANTKKWTPHRPLIRYVASLALVALMTLIGFPLKPILHPTNLVMLYLVAVVISAVFLGRGPSILASVISVLLFDFFFVNPVLSFSVNDTQYILTFIGLLLVGLIISNSASLLRDQIDALRRREHQTRVLNNFSRELTGAAMLDQVLDIVIRNSVELFSKEAIIFLVEEKSLVARAWTPGFQSGENEQAVADWTYKNNQPAGAGTDTISASSIRFMPLRTSHGVVGVWGVKILDNKKSLSFEQKSLMEGFSNLTALAIERASFAQQVAHNEILKNQEKLQTALLNSISHELRTPLASITGVLTSLSESEKAKKKENKLDSSTRLELIESATNQAGQLNQLVENLLDMTRLEAGALRLQREPSDLQDLVGSVTTRMAERLHDKPLTINYPQGLPLIPMDANLIAQVMTNLLDNAIKYSPQGAPIDINVRMQNEGVVVKVKDQGFGIPPSDLSKVFEKFYRSQQNQKTVGTGLGLSICKGIIEAHGGQIWAQNNLDKGTTITFNLPIQTTQASA